MILVKKQLEREDDPNSAASRRCKHIIIGIDGTWQAAFRDPFQSNVHRMNIALNYEDNTFDRNPQIFIYSAGVGTSNKSSKDFAGITGEGLGSLILEAYTNLASNYVPGDKIYLFGFSRGAFAARALTGFISYSGLLKANSLSLVEHAWHDFTNQGQSDFNYADHKADATHRNVEVEFLGVWDTVAGPLRNKLIERYRFTSQKLDKIVKCGVHILSADESRHAYEPVLWTGHGRDGQKLEQIWMPGVHADVGGGYGEAFLSTISLLVMIDKLYENCPDLSFDGKYIEGTLLDIISRQNIVINNERVLLFDKLYRRKLVRRIEAVLSHNRHPIFDAIKDTQVFYKSRRKRRYPAIHASTAALGLANFQPNSWHTRKLMSLVMERCEIKRPS